MEIQTVHHNGNFYQSTLGYYFTKCGLVDRGAYNEGQIGIQKTDDDTKVLVYHIDINSTQKEGFRHRC